MHSCNSQFDRRRGPVYRSGTYIQRGQLGDLKTVLYLIQRFRCSLGITNQLQGNALFAYELIKSFIAAVIYKVNVSLTMWTNSFLNSSRISIFTVKSFDFI